MTASLAASSGQAQEEGHVVNNVPDYVATREYSGPPTRQVNLRHHSGWLRVDGERSSYFEGPGRHVWFTRALDGDRYDSFSIRQEVGTDSTRLESVKTEKLETYLGETCTIWDLVDPADPIGRRSVSFRDCITHDGIQIAHGWAAEDGEIREPPEWRLTSLTRTAVPEEEMSPPAELLIGGTLRVLPRQRPRWKLKLNRISSRKWMAAIPTTVPALGTESDIFRG
jgi:hypothetical protein